MPKITRMGPVALLGLLCATGSLAGQAATASWQITMSAKQNPLALNQCTVIELSVIDTTTRQTPVRPDGKQVDWQDFDLSFNAQPADAFAWSNEAHRFLCARAPAASNALVVASYPASHLAPNQRISGVAQATLEVWQAGQVTVAQGPRAPVYQGPPIPPGQPTVGPGLVQPPAVAPQPPYPQPPPYGQQTGAPTGGQPAYQPQQQVTNPAQPQGAYQPQQTGYPSQPVQPGGAAGPTVGTTQPQQAGSYSNPAAVTPVVAVAPPAVEPKKESGGFFKKLGKHLKDKATEVKNQTTENLTNSATQVVDATAQTGSNLVSGATAQASALAQTKVGNVSNSLVPSALRGGANADNLELAVRSGQAVLRMVHFGDYNAVLDASSIIFLGHLAEVLKANPNPGGYLIKAYVDPLPAGLDPQRLSEDRAAAVKSALEQHGGQGVLKAVGYGATNPSPEVPPWGGPPISARIEIWKLQ